MSRGLASRFGTPTIQDDAEVPAARLAILERALGGDPHTSTSSFPTAPPSPAPADTLFPSANPSATSGVPDRRPISQTVLMWVFAVIALGLLTLVVVWRYTCMRFRNRRSLAQRQLGRTNGTAGLSRSLQGHAVRDSDFVNSWDRETRPIALSPSFFQTDLMPVVDRQGVQINGPRRARGERVRALDVDAGGRRGGGPDGLGAQDDELPAYEAGKGPPGYHIITLEPAPPLNQNMRQAHPSSSPRENTPEIPPTSSPDSSERHGDRPPSFSTPSCDLPPS